MKKVWNTILAMGRPFLLGVLGILIVGTLFTFRLTTLTPGLSQAEIATYNSAQNVSDIVDNSVNAPYRTAVFISTTVFDNTLGLRIVGAVIGILAVVIFYLLARKFFDFTVSLVTTSLFASCSLLLVASRTATPSVMLLSLLAIVGVGYMIRFDKQKSLAWILAALVIGLSLYVPGMIVFVAVLAIWQFTRSRRSFENLTPVTIIIFSVILSILAAPIVMNLIRDPAMVREYLGLPPTLADPFGMVETTFRSTASLFVMAPKNSAYWLGRQPILDVLSVALFLIGIWSLVKLYKLERVWTLLGIVVLVFIYTGLTGNILYIITLLPFVFLIIGFGIHELLSQWYQVFPRNPIARSVGLCIVLAAVALSINFQLQRYFVAWPNNPDTELVFNQTLPK